MKDSGGPPKEQQGPPPPDAAKAEIWLRGHLGHLTTEQQKAFATFQKLIEKEGLYKPATADSKASHDDPLLVRFLRARKFVPQEAFGQFKDTEKWRKENNLDKLYETIELKEYWESRALYPQWTGRRDKRGIPVYLFDVGKLNSKTIQTYTASTSKSTQKGPSPERMVRLFALYENLTRFVMPLCSAAPGRPHAETPVDQSNNIVDISGVGLKQFWSLRSHMQDASQLATAHYPETLDRIFILGAPSFFHIVWGWIKRWFDPITTSKIFVLTQAQVLPTLTQFIDIENIPKRYGGKLEFDFGRTPNLDPELSEYLTISPVPDVEKLFLTAPVKWTDPKDDGAMSAIGVGSIEGSQRSEQMAVLHSLATRVATHNERLSRTNTTVSTVPSAAKEAVVPVAANGSVQPATVPSAAEPPVKTTQETKIVETQPVPPTEKQPAPVVEPPLNGAAVPPATEVSKPPPPADISRQKSEYITPPAEPTEMKTLA